MVAGQGFANASGRAKTARRDHPSPAADTGAVGYSEGWRPGYRVGACGKVRSARFRPAGAAYTSRGTDRRVPKATTVPR